MQCPVCKTTALVMSERQGIEIDYCPDCRGVWLDRGELDKIIDRSLAQPAAPAAPAAAPAPAYQAAPPPYPPQQHHSPERFGHGGPYGHAQHGHGHPAQHGYYKKKKREGFLSDLFDFD